MTIRTDIDRTDLPLALTEQDLMLYAIWTEESPETLPLRLQHRPAHVARLQALQAEGRLIMAGPLPAIDSPDPGPAGFTGSLIVVDFDSLEEAKAFAEADPFVVAGVYQRVTVKPFKRTF